MCIKDLHALPVYVYACALLLCKASAQTMCHGRCESSRMTDANVKLNHALLGHSFRNLTVSSYHECHFHCFHECRCLSFQIQGRRCELLGQDWLTAADDLSPRPGYTLYYMSREYITEERGNIFGLCPNDCGNNCCRSQPCMNGGLCKELCHDPRVKFECSCTEDYTGKLCQISEPGSGIFPSGDDPV